MRRFFPKIAVVGILAATGYMLMGSPSERVIASYTTPLEGRTRSQRHNAIKALQALDGVRIDAGETFSYNRHVGSFSRDQGYRKAPVSYNGQLISSWGGGVCQTSTTLYNTALLAGFEILERHRHAFAPHYAPPGRDAAVAFSNIDLRFRNPYPFPVRIQAHVENDKLKVDLMATQPLPERPQVMHEQRTQIEPMNFELGTRGSRARVRNTGKMGCSVSVYRLWNDRKELISSDEYPAMNRIVEYQ